MPPQKTPDDQLALDLELANDLKAVSPPDDLAQDLSLAQDLQRADREPAFQQWYGKKAKEYGLNPNPDAPEQFYDYRAAFEAGAEPDPVSKHWPSQFKKPGHPNEIVGGFNTRTGERVPGTPRASEQELVRLGWEPEAAKRLAASPEQRPAPMSAHGWTDPASVKITPAAPAVPGRGSNPSANGITDPASVRVTPGDPHGASISAARPNSALPPIAGGPLADEPAPLAQIISAITEMFKNPPVQSGEAHVLSYQGKDRETVVKQSAAQIIESVGKAAQPVTALGAVLNPVSTAAGLVAAGVTAKGAAAAVAALGGDENDQRLAADIAAAVVGSITANKVRQGLAAGGAAARANRVPPGPPQEPINVGSSATAAARPRIGVEQPQRGLPSPPVPLIPPPAPPVVPPVVPPPAPPAPAAPTPPVVVPTEQVIADLQRATAAGDEPGAQTALAELTRRGVSPEQVQAALAPPAPAEPPAALDADLQAADTALAVEAARTDVNTQPTDGQKEAGNYKKGHVTLHGLDITIENPVGSVRSGKDADGNEWSVEMPADYGYIKRTEGADGDNVDVYIGPNHQSQTVFVIDQVDPDTGKFDEHKAVMGVSTPEEARALYEGGFSDGRGAERIGGITRLPVDEFRLWAKRGNTKKPLAIESTWTKREEPATGESGVPVVIPTQDQETTYEGWDTEDLIFEGHHSTEERARAQILEELTRRGLTPEQIRGEEPSGPKPVGSGKTEAATGEPEPGVLVTLTGRRLAPPRQTGKNTNRGVTANVRAVDSWLIRQGIDEAAARGDEFVGGQFRALDPKRLTRSDRDSLNVYLFGQEDVPLSGFVASAQPAADDKPEPKYPFSYDEWAAQYRAAFEAMQRYTPDQVGSTKYAEQMAKLADENPDYLERFEREEEEAAQAKPADKPDEPARPEPKYTVQTMPVTRGSTHERIGYKFTTIIKRDTPFKSVDAHGMTADESFQKARMAMGLPKDWTPAGVESTTEGTTDGEPTGNVAGGQPAEPDGAAANPVREGSSGVLADEPAGDEPRAGAAAAERPVDTPPESLVEGGVRDAAGAGEAPGPLAPTGGGDHPAPVAVSPSGVSHDPGPQPLDYALTPERIAAIVGRGAVQRAKDNLTAIQLVKALQAEQRWATADEQEMLARYVGWGDNAVADYLRDHPAYNWSANEKRIWEQVQALSSEERQALRASTTNAHFTFDLYGPIWDAVTAAGFGGGRVLEPAVGVGHALGLMPPTARAGSTITAVELEPLTAAIAGFLYPSATVQATGFQSALIPRGTQDLAISNVPFAKTGVYDPHVEEFLRKPIQNYFFAKTLDYMRPGGLVVFITTRYTLDAPSHERFRRHIADHADFIGAVRLPSQAFDKTAKTEVVTDVIVLRKRDLGEEASPNNEFFINSEKKADGERNWKGKVVGDATFRSTWYDEHPELIVGEESLTGTMYRSGGYNVSLEKPDELQFMLRSRLSRILTPGLYRASRSNATVRTMVDPSTAKVGELRVGDDGNIVVVNAHGEVDDATPMRRKKGGAEGETEPDTNAIARLTGLIKIRDGRRDLVRLMRDSATKDHDIKRQQRVFKNLYDQFVKLYGTLNSRTNKMLFAGDPEAAALLALETLETKAVNGTDKQGRATLTVTTQVTGLADIFTQRTILPQQRVTSVSTPKDALMASLGERSGIDWPFMEEISGAKAKTLQAALVDEGLVYEQPDGAFVLAEEYLSGDVVTKLEDAKAAGKRFARNVEALTPLLPAPKTREDLINGNVSVTLGAGWVDQEAFAAFAAAQLGNGSVSVTSTRTTAFVKWTVSGDYTADAAANRHPLAVEYGNGSKQYTFLDLLQDTLNLQAPTLGYTVTDGKTKSFVREELPTLAARANQDLVRDLWMQYLFERPELQDKLLDVFNTRYNRIVERTYDGSHLKLPGKVDDSVIKFHPHQSNAVWRILTTGNTLLAHEVGAGKTFEMIAAAMEMKRTGRASKAMITVPTYLIGSWRKDVMKLYPDAKLLAFDEKDLAADRRKVAMARIANGNWDIVLVPHSSFGLLGVSAERMQAVFDRWLFELEAAIKGADEMNVKQLEKVKAALQDKIDRLRAKAEDRATDNALTWEELGVDALFIDEAHAFKNLFFFTEIENVRGLSRSSSDRAIDLYVKVQEINEQSHYRNLVLATATPMMNSMAEAYTMQRYLQPQALEQAGLAQFDLWYAMFAKALPSTEQQPDGTYKEVMRIRDFRNLQLLSKMVRQVMDYVGWEDMPYLDLPAIAGGKVEIVEVQAHPMYEKAKAWFTDRMENIAAVPPHIDKRKQEYVAPMRLDALTGRPTGKPDNILTIMNDAKKAAVDIRLLFGDRAKDFAGSRVQAVADRVAKIYKAGNKQRLTQLLFLDMGTPKELEPLEFLKDTIVSSDVPDEPETDAEEGEEDEDGAASPVLEDDEDIFNLYGAVKRELERRGIPSREIAFIHQAKNGAERTALFDAMNAGTVRVMFASTDKGGVGMNVQKRLVAIHEIDAPRAGRPGDLRQRMGRGIRQGNMNPEVRLIRYVTKGSTDEWLWGMLVNKDSQIQQFMKGRATHLLEEDLSAKSLEEAQMRASGDPRGVELVELKGKRQRLAAQAAAASSAVASAKSDVSRMTERIKHYTRDKADLERWVASKYQTQRGDKFSMRVGHDVFAKRDDANTALIAAVRRLAEADTLIDKAIGEVGTLPIVAKLRRSSFFKKNGKIGESVLVELRLNEDALGGMGEVVSVLEYEVGADISALGAGENLVAQLVNAYERIPARVKGYEAQIQDAEQKKATSEAAIATPSGSIDEHKRVQARIAELEKELKLEGDGVQELDADGKPIPKPKKAVLEIRVPVKQKKTKAKKVATPSRDESPKPAAGGSVGAYAPSTSPATGNQVRPIQFPELVELARELQATPTVVRAFRNGQQRGQFSERGIRLRADLFKAGNEFQLAATLAHEIGHLIDWLPSRSLKRGNLIGRLFSLRSFMKWKFNAPDGSTIHNKEIKAELMALSDAWRPWDRTTATDSFRKYRESSRELYADALSVLLNDPERLKLDAPIFFKQFFDGLDQKPEVKAAYFDLQTTLSGTPAELTARRRAGVRQMFTVGDTKAMDLERLRQAEKALQRKEFFQRLRAQHVDKHTPVIDRVRELEKRGTRLNPDDDPRFALEERNYLGGKLKAFTDKHFLPIYQTLTEAKIDWHEFGEALFYERIIAGDRSELANPRGIAPTVASELLLTLFNGLTPAQRPIIRAQMDAFRTIIKDVAGEAYQAGLYTDALYTQMQANPAYVSFRVIEHIDQDVTSRVYRQIGTLKDITNPADASMLKVLVTLRAIEHNKVKKTVFAFLEKYSPDAIEQAKEVWNGKGHRPIDPKDHDRRMITYFVAGRLRGKYVPHAIADSLENESVGGNMAIVAGLRWMNSGLFRPVFTSFNAGFQTYNFARDFLRFWKNTPTMTVARALRRYYQAVPLARVRAFGINERGASMKLRLAHKELIQAEEAGLLSVTFNDLSKGRHVEDTQIEDTLQRMGVGGFSAAKPAKGLARILKPIVTWMTEVGDFIETLPKAAALYEYKGAGTIAEIPADVRSFIRRKIGSPDYLAGGTHKPITNELFLFSNAITQALRADYEVATEGAPIPPKPQAGGGSGGSGTPPGGGTPAGPSPFDRANFWWKTAATNIVPKLWWFAVLYLLTKDGDDPDSPMGRLRRMARGISEYDMTNYLVVPLGMDGKGNVTYLRVPQDDSGRLLGGLAWKLLRAASGDKDVWKSAMQVFDYTAGQAPNLTPSLGAIGDLAQMASGRNVYDAFRSRFLFTDDEMKAGGWQKTKKFIGYEFQQLGGGVIWKFYAGEQRPRDRTPGQVILDLPILSNVLGRWIKISNFGEVERLRDVQGEQQGDEARARLAERAAVNQALKDYRALPADKKNREALVAATDAIVAKLYADLPGAQRVEKGRRILTKLKMGNTRASSDALLDVVMSATSNAQKVAVIKEAAKGMSKEELTGWVNQAAGAGAISGQVRADLLSGK